MKACLRLIFFGTLLLTSSCSYKNSTEQTKFHDNGESKPVVMIYPPLDSSQHDLNWDLSEELSDMLASSLKKSDRLYLCRSNEASLTSEQYKSLFRGEAGENLSRIPCDFACFFEIMEHELTPRDSGQPYHQASKDLDITMRIRVIDLRQNRANLVLQEIIHQRHAMPRLFSFINYNKRRPGTSFYSLTPLGRAHQKVTDSLQKQIEDYILLAHNNHDFTSH